LTSEGLWWSRLNASKSYRVIDSVIQICLNLLEDANLVYKVGRNAIELIIVIEDSAGSHAASGSEQRQSGWTKMGLLLATKRSPGNFQEHLGRNDWKTVPQFRLNIFLNAFF
jgi:hypothetical protein